MFSRMNNKRESQQKQTASAAVERVRLKDFKEPIEIQEKMCC